MEGSIGFLNKLHEWIFQPKALLYLVMEPNYFCRAMLTVDGVEKLHTKIFKSIAQSATFSHATRHCARILLTCKVLT